MSVQHTHAARRIGRSRATTAMIVFLAVGFVVSCVMLVWVVTHTEKVDYTAASELLLVAVLSIEGIVAVHHLGQARLDSVHEVLVDILQDFRSAEMMLAIATLWRFKIEHGDRFVQEYLERWNRDNQRIAELPDEKQLEALAGTLHYRRRVVKEFYNLLAGLYELGVFPREVLYTYWSEAELRIIPEILIPLETAVAQQLRTETELGGWFKRLQRLYDDRKSHTG